MELEDYWKELIQAMRDKMKDFTYDKGNEYFESLLEDRIDNAEDAWSSSSWCVE